MFNMEIGNRNSIPVAVLTVLTSGTCTTEMLSSEFFKNQTDKNIYTRIMVHISV